ncbi:LCP family protein [Kitasatospora sp. RB6PN24]|uniref:LCP family protein n=1 Tax=Kitasatospora humi TaxID=2893891 RepID=UPI001E500617|nr:LCP family protein [Kitasatospora humi]MCC9311181.1 LCP family protein [Kitasatospora humi]
MTGTADPTGPENGDWNTGAYPHAYQQQPYGDQYEQPYPGYQEQLPYQEHQGYGQQYEQQPYQGYQEQQPYQQQPYGYQEQQQYGQQYEQQPYQGYPEQQPYQPQYEQPYQQQPYYPVQPAAPQAPVVAAPVVPAQQAPAAPQQAPATPQQAPAARPAPPAPPRPRAAPEEPAGEPSEKVGGRRSVPKPRSDQDPYPTDEFTFVDEESEQSEDVIDWLKFAESRTERRDERRRRLRNRLIAGAVALLLAGGGTVGYLWATGALGGDSSAAAATGGRNVDVVHLRDLNGKVTSALLVNDTGGHKASVLLLPDSLKLPSADDSAMVPVGTAFTSMGPAATRDALGTMLGAPVAGTWRLDTPYLRLLVSQIGGIKVDTDAQITGPDGKVLVEKGSGRMLLGDAAVAYATYQAPGESPEAQLHRFGQVLAALITAMPSTLADATDDVHRMGSVPDPSLPEQALAGLLAQLSGQAAAGHLQTTELPVAADGTVDQAKAAPLVKDVLGSTLHSAAATSGPARVSVVDATGSGSDSTAQAAQAQVINAGLTFVPGGGKAAAQPTTVIRYTDDSRAQAAKSLATSLGLPDSAAQKTTDPQTADLVVVLGKDYQAPKGQ